MSNYVSNFAKMILEICKEEGIHCTPLSDYWAFQLQYDHTTNYIYGYQFGLNSAVSHSICSDKSTASQVLSLHHIPNVEHVCCMSPLTMEYASPFGNWDVILKMLETHKQIVCKDNHGTGGNHVFLVSSSLEAENASQIIFSTADSMAVSPYIAVDAEYRVILLDGEVKLFYTKIRPHLIGNGKSTLAELYVNYITEHQNFTLTLSKNFTQHANRILEKGEIFPLQWKHNLGQGASALLLEAGPDTLPILTLAKETVQALDIRFASVDIVKSQNGYQVLEVNSGVMMEYFSGESHISRTLSKNIYREALLKMMKKSL